MDTSTLTTVNGRQIKSAPVRKKQRRPSWMTDLDARNKLPQTRLYGCSCVVLVMILDEILYYSKDGTWTTERLQSMRFSNFNEANRTNKRLRMIAEPIIANL